MANLKAHFAWLYNMIEDEFGSPQHCDYGENINVYYYSFRARKDVNDFIGLVIQSEPTNVGYSHLTFTQRQFVYTRGMEPDGTFIKEEWYNFPEYPVVLRVETGADNYGSYYEVTLT